MKARTLLQMGLMVLLFGPIGADQPLQYDSLAVEHVQGEERQTGGRGSILFEYYRDAGPDTSTPLDSPLYSQGPDRREFRTSFEGPTDGADDYDTCVRGYLYPPETGVYTFWIASHDQSELWLSPDDDPANIVLIASVPGWTPPRDFDNTGGGLGGPQQRSMPTFLAAGQAYYIEALHVAGAGEDNLAVAWQGPGIPIRSVIEGRYLSPLVILEGAADPGLVGWWKLDETSGTTAADSSGSDNHGTVQGHLTWQPTAGKTGGALKLDDASTYVSLPIGSVISSLTNATFAVWVNWSGVGGDWQRVFDFGSGTNVNLFLTPRTVAGGPLRFAITNAGASNEDRTTAPQALPTGWHHVAVTIDAEGKTHTLYVDGQAVAVHTSARYTPASLGKTTQNWLGRSQYSADAYFNGTLDDFRIYNRVLGTSEIAQLAGTSAGDPSLVGWWKLDETSGASAADSSGNDNTGLLHGSPIWQPAAGKIGGALALDGVDDYVDCGKPASLSIAGPVTLAAWVKTKDAGNGQYNPYVGKGNHSCALQQKDNNNLEFVIYDDTWHAVWQAVDSTFNDVWHHLAGTYDGRQLKLYVDGRLTDTADHVGSIARSASDVEIGRNSERNDRLYTGAIDDVRIYRRALSAAEITSLAAPTGVPMPTAQPGSATTCPVVNTQCPAVSTQCPASATRCPAIGTLCPVSDTQCPPSNTKCPPVETQCTPCVKATMLSGGSPTTCEALPTQCTTISTQCPALQTQCPASQTHCPPVETGCPQEATHCPYVLTVCEPPWKCAQIRATIRPESTKCPEQSTTCPIIATQCPQRDTQCPTSDTKCPPELTRCVQSFTFCPEVATQCPVNPTTCPVNPTTCPAIATQCPIVATQCPLFPVSTQCPPVATKCPPSKTQCPVTAVDTYCPNRGTICIVGCLSFDPSAGARQFRMGATCPIVEATCPNVVPKSARPARPTTDSRGPLKTD